MTGRRTHRATALAAYRLDRAAVTVPDILDHLAEQCTYVTSRGRQEGAGGRGSGYSDPTARMAAELAQIAEHRALVLGAVDAVGAAIDRLEHVCRLALGRQWAHAVDAEPAARCIGDGTAQGATCWQVPAERRNALGQTVDDGRCIDCGPRWDAARSAAELARRQRRRADDEAGQ